MPAASVAAALIALPSSRPMQRGASPSAAARRRVGAARARARSCPPLAGALRHPARRIDAPGAVALTFDDGPHPEGTPRVLEILAAHGARATFFMVGEQVRRAPRLAAEVVAAGHAVAVHGDRHRNLLRLTAAAARRRPRPRRSATIEDATGVEPRAAPRRRTASTPGRRCTPSARAAGRRCCGRAGAATGAPRHAGGIAARSPPASAPGDVLLLHDADDYSAPGSHRRTAAALPRVLEAIARGRPRTRRARSASGR